jgi:hypothetical protein
MGQLWYGVDKCGWCLHLVGTSLLYEFDVLWKIATEHFQFPLPVATRFTTSALLVLATLCKLYVTTLVSSFAGYLLYRNSMEF